MPRPMTDYNISDKRNYSLLIDLTFGKLCELIQVLFQLGEITFYSSLGSPLFVATDKTTLIQTTVNRDKHHAHLHLSLKHFHSKREPYHGGICCKGKHITYPSPSSITIVVLIT